MIGKIVIILLKKIYPIEYGENFQIKGILHRRGRGKLRIGNNVTINSSKNSNLLGRGRPYTTIAVSREKILNIGNNVGISNSTIIAFDRIDIEDNVLIGADVEIYDTDFHSLDYTKRGKRGLDIPITRPVRIKENSFIGAHSTILKGVTVGRNAIVGAGSVVTHDIPDNEIWAGNPARFIKKIEE